jgi:hypothetical protein
VHNQLGQSINLTITMNNIIRLLLILVFTLSCSQNRKSNESILTGKTVINSLEIENKIIDSVELELSEIADSLHLVRLETLESVVMGGIYSTVLWENYIVIGTERDYYLFDRKGKYIRRLLKTGRGPEEFLTPQFSQVIRNGVLYFSDAQKNKKYIYSIDLKTGKLNRILRPNTGYIQCFIPDTDTTFLVLSEVFVRDKKSDFSAIRDYSLIRQDFKGTLLNEISLGIEKGVFLFQPSFYSMFINGDDILISKPRFDTLFRFSNFKVQPVWQNVFKTNYNDQLLQQKIPNAHLVHYSDSSILMGKYITDINEKRAWNRNFHLLIIDRSKNKIQVLKKLYFRGKSMPVGFSSDIQLNNDQFCIVLKAKDVDKLLKNPLFSKSIADILVSDSTRTTTPITDFDNPFLLIGKFK